MAIRLTGIVHNLKTNKSNKISRRGNLVINLLEINVNFKNKSQRSL